MKCERMIPNIYEQSFDMRTMCRLFDIEHELLEYYTNHILDCYSPEHCPRNLLPELAEHIGFDYQELKSIMYNRVVVKNFVKNLIRYRGSATGIGNAAAIDIRYRQTYPEYYYKYTRTGVERLEDPDAGKQVPMEFHESIDIQKTWIDVDHAANIIYLFIIASDYFPKITAGMSDEDKQANFEERMRRLLDLAYLQEYVRPVGMYLLPMVAEKVNPYTDITVKAVVIPEYERNSNNGVLGTPNASMKHQYDRMLFAKVENPDDAVSVEPWLRTLYHSQLAGRLKHQYFKKPVYHIEGKFLYYDHDELLSIYADIQQNVPGMSGMKIGDSLYNPNMMQAVDAYNYGPAETDEPMSIQEAGKARYTTALEPLRYKDNVGFPVAGRVYESEDDVVLPPKTGSNEEYPIYQNVPDYESATGYLENAWVGTHVPTTDVPGDADDGTNKNLFINLFDVDADDNSEWTGMDDVNIAGKGAVDKHLVEGTPGYDVSKNGPPTGDDAYWTVNNVETDEERDNPDLYVP